MTPTDISLDYSHPPDYAPDAFNTASQSMVKQELDSRAISPTSQSPQSWTGQWNGQGTQPLTSQLPSELPAQSPTVPIPAATLPLGSRSPTEQPAEPRRIDPPVDGPATDLHGFPISEYASGTSDAQRPVSAFLDTARHSTGSAASLQGSSISTLQSQQNRIKEEKARLSRLQELSEMESRLEEQLQREREEERRREAD